MRFARQSLHFKRRDCIWHAMTAGNGYGYGYGYGGQRLRQAVTTRGVSTMGRQPPTVRMRRLAGELKRLRQAAGLTRDDAAEQTKLNGATLWRIETAKVRPHRRTLIILMNRYGVTDSDERAKLFDLAKDAGHLGWLQDYEDDLTEQYLTYVSFEAGARSIRNYESLFIPGLLQTEEYARAVIAGVLPLASKEEVERRVEMRMQRQAALHRADDPLQLWAIVDEAALHRVVGDAGVMHAQLKALIEVAELPQVTFQVVPFSVGAHTGMPGSFVVMEFPDPADPDLIYVDSIAGDVFVEHESEVRRITIYYQHLQAAALNRSDSVRLIEQRVAALDAERDRDDHP
ncbi:helix-turn-helix transcriptional regulator [Solwaraspora sp. WMMD1047]|uniref:helix-turn-helix domain-containing protein n=1 Tax=Solwaraspora sp. WMMD1047 TaxID=3016102 RepID=UPI0024174090|nr:helix-turn-helix transcriptional regulator [Solwaraspora sp. WMMD1047]MDG4828999.1 helix-turn-helix transcriptional regulator [Solwaraspora sp. WMMD1047]